MNRVFSPLMHFIQYLFQNPLGNFIAVSALLLALGGGGACSNVTGGITLGAPVADLEGGTTREAFVCGNVPGAPTGAVARIANISDVSLGVVEVPLNASDQSYSAEICLKVGQTANVQAFDVDGIAISEISSITRISGEDVADCPEPFVTQEDCPF